MIPKFLRTLNRLGHGSALESDSICQLENQFKDFEDQFTKTMNADSNLAFNGLISTINSLLSELKYIEIQFTKAEKAFNKNKSQDTGRIAHNETEKARREWLREKGVDTSQLPNLEGPDYQRKVALEENLDFFRSLLVFAEGARRHLLLDRLPNDFSEKLSDPEIAPLVAKHFPSWNIDRIAVEANGKSKSSRKSVQRGQRDFKSLLTEPGKNLLPYLLREYKNGKPKSIAAMLYVLSREKLTSIVIEQQQETWIDAMNDFFGFRKPLKRQSVFIHINRWKSSIGANKAFVDRHHQNLLTEMHRS